MGKLASAKEAMDALEADTESSIAQAKVTADEKDAPVGLIDGATEQLQEQEQKVKEVQAQIAGNMMELRKGGEAGQAAVKEMAQYPIKIKAYLTAMSVEMTKLKSAKNKAVVEEAKK